MTAPTPTARLRGVLLVAVIATLLIGGMVFRAPMLAAITRLVEALQALGPIGLVLLSASYVVACVALVPGSLLTLGAGFLAALLWPDHFALALLFGTAAVSVGSVAGATAAFLLGRTLARDWIAGRFAGDKRFAALDAAIGNNGFKMVFLIRLSPAFPFNLLNYALGLTRVSLRDYVLASWLGMLPGTVMYVYLGTGLSSLAVAATGQTQTDPDRYALLALGLAATIALVVLVTRTARAALRAATEHPTDA